MFVISEELHHLVRESLHHHLVRSEGLTSRTIVLYIVIVNCIYYDYQKITVGCFVIYVILRTM